MNKRRLLILYHTLFTPLLLGFLIYENQNLYLYKVKINKILKEVYIIINVYSTWQEVK